ncbi:methyltransferase [Bradyrhizobium lablabi]|uniref:Methyltransferase n=1 Tax=Bradyrhizobium lablabi TaxID=722472 RepID=A0A0R3M9L2_9BRAD|nr:methyltransferase [Bradyrhizobium lablabi]KRR16571.1 methyltransferase [Bradyrhizobium lablabi]
MSSEHQSSPQSPPSHVRLMQMGSFAVPRVLYIAAELGLADELQSGAKSAAELAGPMKLHSPSLHRLMRTLASLGILAERETQRFQLTPLGEALKTEAPHSARSALRAFGRLHVQRAWDHFAYSLQTGRTGMEREWGVPLFDYLAQRPDEASLFSEAMVSFHGNEPPAVARAYDFSIFKTIVDVGGATGNLLATILFQHDRPRGVLFDLPHVVRDALAILRAHGVDERVTIQAGDFFQTVPAGGDAYLLSHVLHDWSEEQCLTILGHCRKAIGPDGRLLIIEMVLPAGDVPHPGKILDMGMLVIMGGRERTEAEYGHLLDRANFRLVKVVPTEAPASIVEAAPV